MAEIRDRKIKAEDWNAYKEALSKVNKAASESVLTASAYIQFSSKEWTDWVEFVANRYGDAAAELACQMFEATAVMQNVKNVKAEPVNTITRQGITRILKESDGDVDYVAGRVEAIVKKQASKTTLYNARKYGCEVAWIPSGDACAFCIMLASNGWRTGRRASYDGVHAHKNCKCEFAVRFNSHLDVDGYDPEQLYGEYVEAGGLNGLRRAEYAHNKDKINEQKREAYARRKANNSDG